MTASSWSRPARWRASPGACCPTCAAARSRCARPRRHGWPPGVAGRPSGEPPGRRRSWSPDRIWTHAAAEVTEIAKVYPGCRPLLGETATVNATLRALDGAPLAHLAAHGHHDQENFLFSRLDLADGPLMAYDIQQLAAAPRHVVLSSCDVGPDGRAPGRGDPRLHRRSALHRDRHGDLQRHPGGRRRRRRRDDRLPPPARGRAPGPPRRSPRPPRRRSSARSSASEAASRRL